MVKNIKVHQKTSFNNPYIFPILGTKHIPVYTCRLILLMKS